MSTQPKTGRGVFIVIEGLTGVGKSTLTWDLSKELDLTVAQIQAPEYREALRLIENDPDALEARHALFFSSICLAARQIDQMLRDGQMVIVDSWIYRTQATHLALGSTLNIKIPAWFPQPDIKLLLTCNEETRRERVDKRGQPSGYWKSQCEMHSEAISEWYRKNVKGLYEIDTAREKDVIMNELLLKVRPTVRKKREFLLSKIKTENMVRRFLQLDLDALDADIDHCQSLIKEAKEMGQEATEQSSESWHDNYNFEESQRLLKMHMNNLGRLSNAREKAVVVSPSDTFETVDIGALVEFTLGDSEKSEVVHIGSYLVGETNRSKGFMSYDAPRVAGLMGARVGDRCKIQLDSGFTEVTVKTIARSPLL